MHWSCDTLNHTAITANPNNKSPHEMWHGTAASTSPHPFLRPAYCRWNRPSKSSPRAESCFYLGPSIDHPSDSLRGLTWANKVVATRDVTWEAVLDVEAPSPQLPEIPDHRRTQGIEDTSEPEGTEGFISHPTNPLPILRMGIPHHLRVVPPMTQASGDFQAKDVEPNDKSTASSESSNSDSSPQAGSDVSTTNSGALSDTSTSDGESLGDASSTPVECGFERCLVDPWVFRLMSNDAVVAMLVVHVDDIKIAIAKEVTDAIVADLNKRLLTKHQGEATWYMGSEY